jgi:hypothetical protein
MTDEMLKKLSRVIQDSDQTNHFPDSPSVFASQECKSEAEINPSHLETNQSDLLTINR